MRIDNELLASLDDGSPATLRIYRWSEPTLSLGHFQSPEEIDGGAPWSTLARVMRRTGGGAIVHHHEWTYSLVIPNGPELGLKGHSEAIYRGVHLAIVQGLREQGWEASLSEECTCTLARAERAKEPFLCYLRRSPVDVVVGGDKIVGSAQRRGKGGLLQHGSLLLRASRHAPELVGIFDLPRNLSASQGLDSEGLSPATPLFASPSQPVWGGVAEENLQNGVELKKIAEWLAERVILGVSPVLECNWVVSKS